MVTRILKSRNSVAPVLDYNEQKVWRGDAVLLVARNIESDSPYAISKAMKALENNPAVSARARKFAFHMTVCPGADDPEMADGTILEYIDDVMSRLGYGRQPYAVYRHNDIDREHYHVVSVNADERGRMIDRKNNAPRLMKVQRELADKYGFRVGLADVASAPDVKPARMRVGMKNILAVMRADFEDVYSSWRLPAPVDTSVISALASWGIECRRGKGPDGDPYVAFRAVDGKGEPTGRFVSSRRVLGRDMLDILGGTAPSKSAAEGEVDEEAKRLGGELREAISQSASLAELQARLARLHVHLHLLAEDGKSVKAGSGASRKTKSAAEIRDILFADMRARRVFRLEELHVPRTLVLSLPHGTAPRGRKTAKRALKEGGIKI